MIDLKAGKKKINKKKIASEENKVLMMRFESKRDSLPRERIDDGARDKASFASSTSSCPATKTEGERETNGRQPPKYYTNTRIKICTYEIKY
jgi:hypothetical protein